MKGSDAAPLILVILGVVCLFGNVAAWIAWAATLLIVGAIAAVIFWKLDGLNRWRKYDFFGRELDLRFQVYQGGGAFFYLDRSTGAAQHFPRGRMPAADPPGPMFPQFEQLPPLLPMIADCRRLAVFGGSGAGKSTLALHMADYKLRQGAAVMVIDPKPRGDLEWPPVVQATGHGYKYDLIQPFFDRINALFEYRKEYFSKHSGRFEKLFVIVDEANLCVDNIPGFADKWRRILQEGRSYNIDLMVLGQSRRAKSLGLEGRMDLLESFECIVGLKYNRRKNERTATAEFSDDDIIQVMHPGPYQGAAHAPHTPHAHTPYTPHTPPTHAAHGPSWERADHVCDAALGYDPNQGAYVYDGNQAADFFDSKDDKLICELYKGGASYRKIIDQVMSKPASGPRLKIIKGVLRKYGLL